MTTSPLRHLDSWITIPSRDLPSGNQLSWHTSVGLFCTLNVFTVFIFLLFLHFSLQLCTAFAGTDLCSITHAISASQALVVVQMPNYCTRLSSFSSEARQWSFSSTPKDRVLEKSFWRATFGEDLKKSNKFRPTKIAKATKFQFGLDPKNYATGPLCPRSLKAPLLHDTWKTSSTFIYGGVFWHSMEVYYPKRGRVIPLR